MKTVITIALFTLLSLSVHLEAAAQGHQEFGLPRETQAMLDNLRNQIERQAASASLINRANEFYREGEAFYKKGELTTARASFEQAKQTLLSREEALFYEQSVHTYFLDLTRQIAELEGTAGLPSLIESELSGYGNERIQQFVNYYQGHGQTVVRTALTRLSEYETMMRTIFQEEGVPQELIYVGMVESAYNPYAQSTAGAKGIWQFIEATGKRYGLTSTTGLDERTHPEKSTRAAAKYLRDLYDLFGDWSLALAAYNAGEHRILNVIRRTSVKDFWQMSRRRLLPQETIDYVPAVLAAIKIGTQNPMTFPGPGVQRDDHSTK